MKWFLSSRKYDPGCSSRIRIPDFLPIPDPGVKKAPDPGSGSATLDRTTLTDSQWTGPGILDTGLLFSDVIAN